MAGIYFHIPFCRQACNYCNFHFSTSLRLKEEMIAAMIKEVLSSEPVEKIETIYFGGGTPSLLTAGEIPKLLTAVYERYIVSPSAEVTMEINPDDITPGNIAGWKAAGINRFSIGIQSFRENDLLWMNRIHNARQAEDSIRMVKDAGFENFSIDLIYGTPGLKDDDWKKNLLKLVELNVPHISSYALTIEPRTPLNKLIREHKKENVDPGNQASQFLMAMDILEDAGYEHYEISNFAKQGFRSRHNSSYWQGKIYTGFGPSAHSYNGRSRRWNVSNNPVYIRSIQNNETCYEEELLTAKDRLNEYIMTSLRTAEGLRLDYVKENFGEQQSDKIKAGLAKYDDSKVRVSGARVVLTREGKLFADGIASDLFF